jgi:hypothetical protein
MIRKKKCVKPATEAQKKALRAIAKEYNQTLENLCWYVSGHRTQLINNLTYKEVSRFLKEFYNNELL